MVLRGLGLVLALVLANIIHSLGEPSLIDRTNLIVNPLFAVALMGTATMLWKKSGPEDVDLARSLGQGAAGFLILSAVMACLQWLDPYVAGADCNHGLDFHGMIPMVWLVLSATALLSGAWWAVRRARFY
ncbi:MAG: hypothetical protein A2X36_14915 [Elusimicrobia bacterium GWA2_69_24]|nr:MAG: hypothetical protein A2X36_14915 [Elusimicrobia bacterium GWA2_69_24]HBL19189.1 hypothetical protein [Elusimicrobiota bacterium]